MSNRQVQVSEHEIAARHAAAHDLASPIRAVAILSDLLEEEVRHPEPDLDTVRKLAAQLVSASEAATEKLAEFATALDA